MPTVHTAAMPFSLANILTLLAGTFFFFFAYVSNSFRE